MVQEFNKVFCLEYGQENFLVLENKLEKYYYFLKIYEENKLVYPTLDEFVQLNTLILSARIPVSFDKREENKNSSFPEKLLIIPKIAYKSSLIVLTGLVLTTVLASCNGNISIESTKTQTEQTTANSSVLPEVIYASGIEDTSNYLDVQNPSWNDLIMCVENNSSINDKYKKYLIDGITNLQKNMPNLRLDVLYYNISGLQIIEQDRDAFSKNFSNQVLQEQALGYFKAENRTVYLCNEAENIEATFLHEALGHGSGILRITKENADINSSIRINDYNKLNYIPNHLMIDMGYSFEEARAEMVALLAQNEHLSSASSYREHVQELSVLLEASDLNLSDISNQGLSILINRICDMGINCFDLVNNSDKLQDCQRQGKVADINEKYYISNNIKSFIFYYYNHLLNDGYSENEAIVKIKEICNKCEMGPVLSGGIFIYDAINISYELPKIIESIKNKEEPKLALDLNYLEKKANSK